MPMPPGGHIQYANMPPTAFVSGTVTLNHGIGPSSITINAAPTPPPASTGDVTITYGGLYVRLFNCRLVQIEPAEVMKGSPTRQILHIVDRRWAWVNRGWIRGLYNFREGDGTLRLGHYKTPQKLAKLLFEAMGETKFDVSALPDFEFPYSEWDGNPARYLETLCNMYGCRVSLNPINNQARIVKVGTGAALPFGLDIIDDSFDMSPPQKPPKVVFYGGRTLYQMDLELEAVGKEPDTGEIKLIDDLSYKPPPEQGGWFACAYDFPRIEFKNKPSLGELTYQQVAQADIWKLFRIKTPFWLPYETTSLEGGAVSKHPGRTIRKLEEILPLESKQLQTRVQRYAPQVQSERIEPWVLGDFDPYIDDFMKENEILMTSSGKKYRKYEGNVSVDVNRGLVRFSQAITMPWDESLAKAYAKSNAVRDGTQLRYKHPKLFLRIGFGVREEQDMTWTRYALERVIKDNTTPGTLPHYLRREDVVRRVFHDYDAKPTLQDNGKALQTTADFYIDQYLATIQMIAPATRRYAGLKLIVIDGAIQQTVWNVDEQGYTTTTASHNQEAMVNELTWQQKENLQKARLAFDENSLFNGGTRNSLVSEF